MVMFQHLLLTLLLTPRAGSALGSFDITEKCDRTVDTAIVGGGPSGAYSAYKLKDSDERVELVEYTDHIGGRLMSFTFPGVDDVTVEFGDDAYSERHRITARLIEELNFVLSFSFPDLTPMDQPIPWITAGDSYFYMRKQLVNESDIWSGTANVPYQMTKDEKKNIGRIGQYYLEKLTGYSKDLLPEVSSLHLRVRLRDSQGNINVPLYRYNITEALSLVASQEGMQFFTDLVKQKIFLYKDANALMVFSNFLNAQSKKLELKTLKEGMLSLPQRMVEAFQKSNSEKHTVVLNRKLDSITKIGRWNYLLKLKVTTTSFHQSLESGPEENLCASKVILALPAESLKIIQYLPLKSGLVADALNSVRTVPVGKVAMTFDRSPWGDKPTVFSDETIGKISELGQGSGKYVLQASFAEAERVTLLQGLNLDPPTIFQHPKIADLAISNALASHVLDKLSEIYGKKFPYPEYMAGYFWTRFPQSGGNTVWRAGYHYGQVRDVIQRPSLMDDVYIVGNDFSWGTHQAWVEGSLETVDEVMARYLLDRA